MKLEIHYGTDKKTVLSNVTNRSFDGITLYVTYLEGLKADFRNVAAVIERPDEWGGMPIQSH